MRCLLHLSLASCLGLVGCGLIPTTPRPWYDLDVTWLNDGLAAGQPHRGPRPAEVRAAAQRRSDDGWRTPWAPAATVATPSPTSVASASSQPARPPSDAGEANVAATPVLAIPRSSDPVGPGSSLTITGRSARTMPPSPEPASEKVVTRTSSPSASTAAAPPAEEAVAPVAGGFLLGDGSPSGDVLAAARRLLGRQLGDRTLLSHLFAVGALNTPWKRSPESPVRAYWEALGARDRVFKADLPAPGDLAFMHHTRDVDGDGGAWEPLSSVAVVELVEDDVVHCIGLVRGVVRRFVMDPRRPWAVRVGGKRVNSAIRERHLTDGPEMSGLAGALFAGYGRLR